jgi:hypothetical protein
MTTGDLCLQLKIQDGGANDTNGVRNFIVKDPCGLAFAPEPELVTETPSASGRVGALNLWFMLLLSVATVFAWRL